MASAGDRLTLPHRLYSLMMRFKMIWPRTTIKFIGLILVLLATTILSIGQHHETQGVSFRSMVSDFPEGVEASRDDQSSGLMSGPQYEMIVLKEPQRQLLDNVYSPGPLRRDNLVHQISVVVADSSALDSVGLVFWHDAKGDHTGTFSGEFCLVSYDPRSKGLRVHYRAIDPQDGLSLNSSWNANPIYADNKEMYRLSSGVMIYNLKTMIPEFVASQNQDSHDWVRVPFRENLSLEVTRYIVQTVESPLTDTSGIWMRTFMPHIFNIETAQKVYQLQDIPLDVEGGCSWIPLGEPGSQDYPGQADIDHANGWDLVWLEIDRLCLVVKSARSTMPYPLQVWIVDLENQTDRFLPELSLVLSALTGPGQHDVSFVEGRVSQDSSVIVEWYDNNDPSCSQQLVSFGRFAKIHWNGNTSIDEAEFTLTPRAGLPIGPSGSRGSSQVFFIDADTMVIINAGSHPVPSSLVNDPTYGNVWNINSPGKAIYKVENDFRDGQMIAIIQSIQPDPLRQGDSTLFRHGMSYRFSATNSKHFPDYEFKPTLGEPKLIEDKIHYSIVYDSLPIPEVAMCWHQDVTVLASDTLWIPKELVDSISDFMLYTTCKLTEYVDEINWIGRVQSRDYNIQWLLHDTLVTHSRPNEPIRVGVYTNPVLAGAPLQISGLPWPFQAKLISSTGSEVVNMVVQKDGIIVPSLLSSGLYILHLNTQRSIITKRIIIHNFN